MFLRYVSFNLDIKRLLAVAAGAAGQAGCERTGDYVIAEITVECSHLNSDKLRVASGTPRAPHKKV
jgi:hypothetical protein